MGNIKKISGAYGGGSPRKNYKNSTKTIIPTSPETEKVTMYEGVVKNLYLNNQMSSEDVQHFIYLLEGLKNGTSTTVNLDSKFILTLITPINELYLDGSINEKFLTNLISKLTDILELTPLPILEPTIKDKLSSLDNVKSSEKVRNVKPKAKIDTSIKKVELDEISETIGKKFIHKEISIASITIFINSLTSLYQDEFAYLVDPTNIFLQKSLEYIKDLYNVGKITKENLEYLTASLTVVLELPQIDKPQKQIKDKVSAISKNYKK